MIDDVTMQASCHSGSVRGRGKHRGSSEVLQPVDVAHGAAVGGGGERRLGAQRGRHGAVAGQWPVATRRLDRVPTPGQLGIVHAQLDAPAGDVDVDQVAVGAGVGAGVGWAVGSGLLNGAAVGGATVPPGPPWLKRQS